MTKPLESILRANLLKLASAYSKASGLAISTISLRAVNDGRFLKGVEDGLSFSVRKYDNLIAWFNRQDWKGRKLPVLTDPKHNQKGLAHGAQTRKHQVKKVGHPKGGKASRKARR